MTDLNFSGKKQLPQILQTSPNESSLICIVMIAYYYGSNIGLNTLRAQYAAPQHVETNESLIEAADKVQLASRVISLHADELEKLVLPAILHWDQNRYVVLKKVGNGEIAINDPSLGHKKYSLREAKEHFSGTAFELTPTKDFENKIKKKKLKFNQLWNRAVGLKRGIAQLLLLSFMIEVFTVSMPFLTQLIVDDVLVNSDYSLLALLAIGFSLIVIMRNVTTFLRSYTIMFLGNKISFQFSLNVYRHLLRLPAEYFSSRHMGDIVSRYNSTTAIKDFLTGSIVGAFIDGILVLGTVTLMFVYSKLLTFIALFSIVLYGVIRVFMYRYLRQRHEEALAAKAEENTNFMENIANIQGIKLFCKESDRIALWQNYLVNSLNSDIRVQKLNMINTLFNGLLLGFDTIIIACLGALAVLEKELSTGMLLAFFFHKDNLLTKSFSLLDTAINFKMLDVHLARLGDIALTQKEQEVQQSRPHTAAIASTSFFSVEKLKYRHSENDELLFDNINLVVDKEESISIIGHTGCGKSTLLKLLTSLYTPTGGNIFLNGVSLYQMGLSHYRQKISAVLQNDTLLTGTIAENICFFDPFPDYERIEYVSELAAIHQNILSKPMQYNTHIGNLGTGLSGGEGQRILLARALYRKPHILFLDEATSHLDMETEKLVNKAVAELKIARIMVAHRPDTIKLADRILQLTPDGLISVSRKDL